MIKAFISEIPEMSISVNLYFTALFTTPSADY